MFYAQFVLSKKGPLAKIWLAAHWEKKLSRAQIYETNVEEAVGQIIEPKQNMALRTTGHLLLGIVRIYSRKTKYLLADCNEAFLKIKMAFRNGVLDAPDETETMNTSSTVIPEVFGDFETSLPEFNEADYSNNFVSQTRLDDITLKEDHLTEASKYASNFEVDDFGEHAAGITYDDSFEDDVTLEFPRECLTIDSLFNREESREPTPCLENGHAPGKALFNDDEDMCDSSSAFDDDDEDRMTTTGSEIVGNDENTMDINDDMMSVKSFASHGTTSTIERDSIQLEAMDVSGEKLEKKKRKRKLLVDEQKNITGEEMKANMADYRDTLNVLDLSPPTRKLMNLKSIGTAEKLFHLPGTITLKAKPLIRQYQTKLFFNREDRSLPKNDVIRSELEMSEVVEDTMLNHPDFGEQGSGFADEFDDVEAVDFDNYVATSPERVELSSEEPQPLVSSDEPMEDTSPVEKKKRKEHHRAHEEEEIEDDDNRFSKRTQGLLNSIANKIRSSDEEMINLSDMMTKGSTRKTAAQKFYTLLVLKKWQAIDVKQNEPFDEIKITAGPNIGQTSL